MNEKEIRKQFNEVVRVGLRKIIISEEFSQMLNLSRKISNNRLILKCILYILGFIFAPRVLLIYTSYRFIKMLVKLALFIIEVEKEEGISIVK